MGRDEGKESNFGASSQFVVLKLSCFQSQCRDGADSCALTRWRLASPSESPHPLGRLVLSGFCFMCAEFLISIMAAPQRLVVLGP